MALASNKVTPAEKKAMAEALLAVKDDFDVSKVETDYTNFDVLDIWPESEPRPSLAQFINKDS